MWTQIQGADEILSLYEDTGYGKLQWGCGSVPANLKTCTFHSKKNWEHEIQTKLTEWWTFTARTLFWKLFKGHNMQTFHHTLLLSCSGKNVTFNTLA